MKEGERRSLCNLALYLNLSSNCKEDRGQILIQAMLFSRIILCEERLY